ncbi:hypothetical protein LIER_37632 [Lithospermum erythrorhizon]|uniref:Uncharacterized protein n=1 Tax=Lithospermum erythrorhizon TaxID=34254 RepID=A0AAV3PPU3_LITER
MVRTRGGVNTSGKATKGKKKVEEVVDDACRVVEPPMVEAGTQKLKKQKNLKRGKGEGSNATASTRKNGDEDEDDVGVAIAPIVKGRVGDSSCAEIAADLSKHTTVLSATDSIEEGVEPSVREGVTDTLNTEDVVILEDADREKKKSKKRKHKKSADVGEACEPKKKLRKEEQGTKKARRAERKAKNDGEKEKDYAKEGEKGSDEEDVVSIVIKKRKAKDKLKINENRSRVGNKRIPKNVVAVATENVALSSEEEKVKWRFVASRRIAAERMLSEVTKKNADIMENNLKDDIKHLDGVLQSTLARKSVLEARLMSLDVEKDFAVDPDASDNEAQFSQE